MRELNPSADYLIIAHFFVLYSIFLNIYLILKNMDVKSSNNSSKSSY